MSINKTKEQNFKSYVEQTLIEKSGWKKGDLTEWNKKTAIFPARIIDFIQSSQPRLYAQMEKLHGAELHEKIIVALKKSLSLKGTFHILRHGFKFYGKTFDMAFFKPAHGLNPEVVELYNKNLLTVTRQVSCHPKH